MTFPKKMRRITATFFSFILLLGSLIPSVPVKADDGKSSVEWPTPPELFSESAILIDADTGAILYEKNAYEKAYPASTTKMITGLLAIENCRLDETVTASFDAVSSISFEDANIGTKVGEEYSMEQALYALLIYSANEVAYMLAEHVAGDLPTFVMMMNKRAEELGAKNTHFNNASGLYDPNHYTTAYDLAMIGRGCLNNASFVSFDSYSDTYILPATNKTSTSRTLYHRHKMLRNGSYYYEYCKGGKTGFTDQSKYTLVTFAQKGDVRLVCVVLKSGENERFEDTIKLFDYGFDNFSQHTVSASKISSIFSGSNYLSSNVFSNNSAHFSMASSNIELPKNVEMSNIAMRMADEEAPDSGSFETNVNFYYDDHIVGASKITLSTNNTAGSKLPYKAPEAPTNYKPRDGLIINIWILIIVIFAIFSVFWIRNIVLNKKAMSRRHYKNKLHF